MSYQSHLSLESSMMDVAPGYSSQRHPNQSATRDQNQSSSHIDPQTYTFPKYSHNYNAATGEGQNQNQNQNQIMNQHSMLPSAHGSTPGTGTAQYYPALGSAQATLGATLGSDAYPPPASLATVNSDAIDLNDEIFFTYHAEPAYTTTASDPFAPAPDVGVSSSSSSTANFDYAYPVHAQSHDAGASPLKHFDAFDGHYSHTRRFSSAVEQLNRMSLHGHTSSKSPSPELFNVPQNLAEERTINPQQLFGTSVGENRVDLSPHFSSITVAAEAGSQNAAKTPARYILPSSVSSPSLSTFFSRSSAIAELDEPPGNHNSAVGNVELSDMSQGMSETSQLSMQPDQFAQSAQAVQAMQLSTALQNAPNSYAMNDECVSAITYWLNNTADVISEKPVAGVVRNPTGVMKPGWSRRNSIQVVSPRTEDAPSKVVRTLSTDQKRRRRKSVNSASVPSVSLPANFALNFASSASAQSQAQSHKANVKSVDSGSSQRHSQGQPGQNQIEKHMQHQMQSQASSVQNLQNLQQLSDMGNLDDMLANHALGNAPVPVRTPTLPSSSKMADQSDYGYTFKGGFDLLDTGPDPNVANAAGDGNGKPPSSSDPESLQVNSADFAGLNLDLKSGDAPDASAAANDDDEPKPFPCPDCEKQFKRSEHLKRHIRSVHSNIRPFHCKYCEKKFSRSDNLAQHSKTHFKVNANGTTSVIYGNPNPQSRSGRKKSSGDVDMEAPVFEE